MFLDGAEISHLADEFEDKDAYKIIEWVNSRFGDKATIAFSGQVEDCVILHIMHEISGKNLSAFMLDTGRLNEEVYDLVDRIYSKYGIKIRLYSPDSGETEDMVGKYGANLFYKDPKYRIMCCGVRKVNVLKRVLKDYAAWITGVRRGQVSTRAQTKKIQFDAQFSLVKVSPIADWTWKRVWDYIKDKDVPYCSLYDKGYTSIGCEPCTRPTFITGDEPTEEELRKGRWWWERKDSAKECGIHFSYDKNQVS